MVPVYVVVALLKLTPAIDYISGLFGPFMVYFGLPGESALAFVTGSFVNLYAALAVIAGIQLTAKQVTILAIMLGVSHTQIMESAILAKMKARPIVVTSARVVFSFVCGYVLNLVLAG
jgi:spore maturation protein SpmB